MTFPSSLIRFLLLTPVILGGCEPASRVGRDSLAADGGADPADGSSPAMARITVLSNRMREPQVGVPVVFFDPDGQVNHRVTTGADGVASAEVVAGSTVIAFLEEIPEGGGPSLLEGRAVFDVHGGDDILLAGYWLPGGPIDLTMTVVLPDLGPGSLYEVETPCGRFDNADTEELESSVTIEFPPSCRPEVFTIMAVGSTIGKRGYLTGSDIALQDGGVIDLSSAVWQVATSTDRVTVTEIPDVVANVTGNYGLGRLGMSSVSLSAYFYSVQQAESDASVTLPVLSADAFDAATFRVGLSLPGPAPARQDFTVWRSPIGDDFTLPVGELMLPWFGPVEYDAVDRSFAWTQDGDQPWDATYIHLSWRLAPNRNYHRWTLVAPPGTTGIVLPPMPDEFAGWLPPDPDYISVAGAMMESSLFDGWSEARQVGLDGLRDDFILPDAPVPSAMRMSVTGLEL